jgi:trans-aconitate 2-methyltransferase
MAAKAADTWNPDQYSRFQSERDQPFFDLMALLKPTERAGPTVVDLGCGTGHLTQHLHNYTKASTTLGVDSSLAMLAKATPLSGNGLTFGLADIGSFKSSQQFDIVFSNAALQWVDGHDTLVPRVLDLVRPGGQLAFQIPANHDYHTHTIARELASEMKFRDLLSGFARETPVLSPEVYAEILARHGVRDMHVRLQGPSRLSHFTFILFELTVFISCSVLPLA